MSKKLEEAVIALQNEVSTLKAQMKAVDYELAAINSICKVLAIRCCENSAAEKDKTIALFDVMSFYADHMEELKHGQFIRQFRKAFSAILDGGDPLAVLALLALQGKDVGRDRLPALYEWIRQASDGELAQDFEELFQKYGLPSGLNPSSDGDNQKSDRSREND